MIILILLGFLVQISYSFCPLCVNVPSLIQRPNAKVCLAQKEAEEETTLEEEVKFLLGDASNSTSEFDKKKSEPRELRKRPKINLSWCGRENCDENVLRERVVGLHNEIMFDHPATGQVAYHWSNEEEVKPIPTVLVLVKKNDEGLMKVAADVSRYWEH
jgi:hypothetical protein